MSSVYVWPVVPLDGVNADADDRIREKSSVSAAVISLVSVNYFLSLRRRAAFYILWEGLH